MIRTSRTAESVKVTFALPLDLAAGRCSVVGDFNEWLPGTHELRLRFRYLGENGNWFNDPDIADQDGSDTVVVV